MAPAKIPISAPFCTTVGYWKGSIFCADRKLANKGLFAAVSSEEAVTSNDDDVLESLSPSGDDDDGKSDDPP